MTQPLTVYYRINGVNGEKVVIMLYYSINSFNDKMISLTVYKHRNLKKSKRVKFFQSKISFNLHQKVTKFNVFCFFVFKPSIFFLKQLIRFVNDLKINGLRRLLTHSSIDFRKPPISLTELCPALLV